MSHPRILIEVGGGVVGVLAVDAAGQCNGTGLNFPGQTLADAIRKHDTNPNLVLVHDAIFGTGYHTITQACGAGGAGWTYRLTPYYSDDEAVAAHDAMVQACKAGRPVGKSGLAIAFDRLESERHGRSSKRPCQHPDSEFIECGPEEGIETRGCIWCGAVFSVPGSAISGSVGCANV